jgi:hypothetical protein
MAASLSTPLIAPGVLAPVATGLALAAGAVLAWRSRGAEAQAGPWRFALLAGVVAGLAALAWASLGAGRAWPPACGALAGAFLALAGASGRAEGGPGRELAVVLLGAAGLGAASLVLPPGVELANAAIAAVGALALGRVALAGAAGGTVEAGGLGAAALLGGLVAWGDRLVPDGTLGAPLALGSALALAATAGVASRVLPKQAALATAGLGLATAWGVLNGLFQLPTAWWACAALGLVAGVGLVGCLAVAGAWERLGGLVAVAGAGLLMVLDSRLAGVVGIALGGLGLATVGAALPAGHRARSWLALLTVVVAVRVWLQLFLDRVALTGYGVDLTHPYATAALLAGALFPALVAATARAWWGRPPAAAAVLALGAAAPALVGYFLHLEALGAWLVGLIAAVFIGALGSPVADEAPDTGLAAGLLAGHAAVALLAAPWLVSVMNVTRGERLVALAALTLALGVAMVLAWPRPAAAAATVEG